MGHNGESLRRTDRLSPCRRQSVGFNRDLRFLAISVDGEAGVLFKLLDRFIFPLVTAQQIRR